MAGRTRRLVSGPPLVFALFAGWWSGGSLCSSSSGGATGEAIDVLAIMVIGTASLVVAEHLFGKTYGWLVAMVPLLAYVGISALYTRRRERRGEPGAK